VTEVCSFSTLPESTQNVRLTSEARPAKQVGAMRAGLSGIFSFLIAFFLFSVHFLFWTLKHCKHRDKAQVWFKRLLGSLDLFLYFLGKR